MSPLGVEDVRVVVAVPLDDRLVAEAAAGLQVVRVGEEVTRSAASVDASPMLLWRFSNKDADLRSIVQYRGSRMILHRIIHYYICLIRQFMEFTHPHFQGYSGYSLYFYIGKLSDNMTKGCHINLDALKSSRNPTKPIAIFLTISVVCIFYP